MLSSPKGMDVIVTREITIVGTDGDRILKLEVGRPAPEKRSSGPWVCRVALTDGRQRYETQALGEDGLQALKLGLRAADMKVRSMAASENTRAFWLGSEIPPVFEELEAMHWLSRSLENAIEALELARSQLLLPHDKRDEEMQLPARLSKVVESVGVVDVYGRHLRDKQPADYSGAFGSGMTRRQSRSEASAPGRFAACQPRLSPGHVGQV